MARPLSPATAYGKCPDPEVRLRLWQTQTNFGIDQDTCKDLFLACFLDLKFAAALAQA
jgi:hypothetical protein